MALGSAYCNRRAALIIYDRMALLLDIWWVVRFSSSGCRVRETECTETGTTRFRLSLILGILYLTFQAFPIIFGEKHGFNAQDTGLSFLGVGVGLAIAMVSQIYWNRCVTAC